MLIGFLLNFVADTKIIYGYNFVTPLSMITKYLNKDFRLN